MWGGPNNGPAYLENYVRYLKIEKICVFFAFYFMININSRLISFSPARSSISRVLKEESKMSAKKIWIKTFNFFYS